MWLAILAKLNVGFFQILHRLICFVLINLSFQGNLSENCFGVKPIKAKVCFVVFFSCPKSEIPIIVLYKLSRV